MEITAKDKTVEQYKAALTLSPYELDTSSWTGESLESPFSLPIEDESSEMYTPSNEALAILELLQDSYDNTRRQSIGKYVIGYTALPINIAKEFMGVQRNKAKYSLLLNDDKLGRGMYFYEDNTEYAAEKAKATGNVVMGAVLDLKMCIDITNQRLHNVINRFCAERNIHNDYELFEALRKEGFRCKVNSARAHVNYGVQLYKDSIIQKYSITTICLYDQSCIIQCFDPTKTDNIPVIEYKVGKKAPTSNCD